MSDNNEKSTQNRRPFPRHTLEEAIKVSQAIQDKNAGQPMQLILLAEAIEMSPGSTNFRDVLSSSIKYGLSSGSFNSKNVSLTQLGQDMTKPTSAEAKISAIRRATLQPEIFRKIFDRYKNNKFPSGSFFQNTLERDPAFKVPREYVVECEKVVSQNFRYAHLTKEVQGSLWVIEVPIDSIPNESVNPALDEKQDSDIPISNEKFSEQDAEVEERAPASKEVIKPIFVAHGKNEKPLMQLKEILDRFGIPYRVAVYEPHRGRPISEKVSSLMNECGSAILIFTADEEFKDSNGNTVLRPSENVVYELGAAGVKYGNRIVIFKEDSLDFASNFKDIGYISFKKDELNSRTMELIQELIAMGFLKIGPA